MQKGFSCSFSGSISCNIIGRLSVEQQLKRRLKQQSGGESSNGKNKVWWVQMESVVGFFNKYQRTG